MQERARAVPWKSPDVVAGVGVAAIGFLLGGLGPCLVLLARDLGVARNDLAWLSSGFGVALVVAGLAGPWLLGLGATRVLRVSAIGLAVGIGLLAAPTLLLAKIGALVLGAGGAGVVIASSTLLGGPGAPKRFARVNAGASVASVSAPLLIGAVDALAGNGRLALLVPVPCLLWVAASAGTAWTSPVLESEPAAPAPGGSGTHLSLRVAASWFSLFGAVSAEFAFLIWGAARLQDSGLDAAGAATAAAAFPIGMAAGRLAAPKLIGRAPVVGIAVSLGIAGALVAAAPVGPRLVTAAIGVAGLGIAALYPVKLARLVGTAGLSLHQGASLGAAASGTAALASPTLLALLAASTSLRLAFLAVVPLLLLVFALGRRGPPITPGPFP